MRIVQKIGVAAACAGLMLTSPVAFAHDVVMKANPADKSTVESFPREIVLEFSGVPKDTFNTVAVSNVETGQVLFSESPQLDNEVVSVRVPDDVNPGAGDYKVGFQITSSDGHATRGMTTFTVAGNAASTAASSAASQSRASEEPVVSSSESPHSPNTYLAVGIGAIVAVVALIIGAVMMIAKKRK